MAASVTVPRNNNAPCLCAPDNSAPSSALFNPDNFLDDDDPTGAPVARAYDGYVACSDGISLLPSAPSAAPAEGEPAHWPQYPPALCSDRDYAASWHVDADPFVVPDLQPSPARMHLPTIEMRPPVRGSGTAAPSKCRTCGTRFSLLPVVRSHTCACCGLAFCAGCSDVATFPVFDSATASVSGSRTETAKPPPSAATAAGSKASRLCKGCRDHWASAYPLCCRRALHVLAAECAPVDTSGGSGLPPRVVTALLALADGAEYAAACAACFQAAARVLRSHGCGDVVDALNSGGFLAVPPADVDAGSGVAPLASSIQRVTLDKSILMALRRHGQRAIEFMSAADEQGGVAALARLSCTVLRLEVPPEGLTGLSESASDGNPAASAAESASWQSGLLYVAASQRLQLDGLSLFPCADALFGTGGPVESMSPAGPVPLPQPPLLTRPQPDARQSWALSSSTTTRKDEREACAAVQQQTLQGSPGLYATAPSASAVAGAPAVTAVPAQLACAAGASWYARGRARTASSGSGGAASSHNALAAEAGRCSSPRNASAADGTAASSVSAAVSAELAQSVLRATFSGADAAPRLCTQLYQLFPSAIYARTSIARDLVHEAAAYAVPSLYPRLPPATSEEAGMQRSAAYTEAAAGHRLPFARRTDYTGSTLPPPEPSPRLRVPVDSFAALCGCPHATVLAAQIAACRLVAALLQLSCCATDLVRAGSPAGERWALPAVLRAFVIAPADAGGLGPAAATAPTAIVQALQRHDRSGVLQAAIASLGSANDAHLGIALCEGDRLLQRKRQQQLGAACRWLYCLHLGRAVAALLGAGASPTLADADCVGESKATQELAQLRTRAQHQVLRAGGMRLWLGWIVHAFEFEAMLAPSAHCGDFSRSEGLIGFFESQCTLDPGPATSAPPPPDHPLDTSVRTLHRRLLASIAPTASVAKQPPLRASCLNFLQHIASELLRRSMPAANLAVVRDEPSRRSVLCRGARAYDRTMLCAVRDFICAGVAGGGGSGGGGARSHHRGDSAACAGALAALAVKAAARLEDALHLLGPTTDAGSAAIASASVSSACSLFFRSFQAVNDLLDASQAVASSRMTTAVLPLAEAGSGGGNSTNTSLTTDVVAAVSHVQYAILEQLFKLKPRQQRQQSQCEDECTDPVSVALALFADPDSRSAVEKHSPPLFACQLFSAALNILRVALAPAASSGTSSASLNAQQLLTGTEIPDPTVLVLSWGSWPCLARLVGALGKSFLRGYEDTTPGLGPEKIPSAALLLQTMDTMVAALSAASSEHVAAHGDPLLSARAVSTGLLSAGLLTECTNLIQGAIGSRKSSADTLRLRREELATETSDVHQVLTTASRLGYSLLACLQRGGGNSRYQPAPSSVDDIKLVREMCSSSPSRTDDIATMGNTQSSLHAVVCFARQTLAAAAELALAAAELDSPPPAPEAEAGPVAEVMRCWAASVRMLNVAACAFRYYSASLSLLHSTANDAKLFDSECVSFVGDTLHGMRFCLQWLPARSQLYELFSTSACPVHLADCAVGAADATPMQQAPSNSTPVVVPPTVGGCPCHCRESRTQWLIDDVLAHQAKCVSLMCHHSAASAATTAELAAGLAATFETACPGADLPISSSSEMGLRQCHCLCGGDGAPCDGCAMGTSDQSTVVAILGCPRWKLQSALSSGICARSRSAVIASCRQSCADGLCTLLEAAAANTAVPAVSSPALQDLLLQSLQSHVSSLVLVVCGHLGGSDNFAQCSQRLIFLILSLCSDVLEASIRKPAASSGFLSSWAPISDSLVVLAADCVLQVADAMLKASSMTLGSALLGLLHSSNSLEAPIVRAALAVSAHTQHDKESIESLPSAADAAFLCILKVIACCAGLQTRADLQAAPTILTHVVERSGGECVLLQLIQLDAVQQSMSMFISNVHPVAPSALAFVVCTAALRHLSDLATGVDAAGFDTITRRHLFRAVFAAFPIAACASGWAVQASAKRSPQSVEACGFGDGNIIISSRAHEFCHVAERLLMNSYWRNAACLQEHTFPVCICDHGSVPTCNCGDSDCDKVHITACLVQNSEALLPSLVWRLYCCAQDTTTKPNEPIMAFLLNCVAAAMNVPPENRAIGDDTALSVSALVCSSHNHGAFCTADRESSTFVHGGTDLSWDRLASSSCSIRHHLDDENTQCGLVAALLQAIGSSLCDSGDTHEVSCDRLRAAAAASYIASTLVSPSLSTKDCVFSCDVSVLMRIITLPKVIPSLAFVAVALAGRMLHNWAHAAAEETGPSPVRCTGDVNFVISFLCLSLPANVSVGLIVAIKTPQEDNTFVGMPRSAEFCAAIRRAVWHLIDTRPEILRSAATLLFTSTVPEDDSIVASISASLLVIAAEHGGGNAILSAAAAGASRSEPLKPSTDYQLCVLRQLAASVNSKCQNIQLALTETPGVPIGAIISANIPTMLLGIWVEVVKVYSREAAPPGPAPVANAAIALLSLCFSSCESCDHTVVHAAQRTFADLSQTIVLEAILQSGADARGNMLPFDAACIVAATATSVGEAILRSVFTHSDASSLSALLAVLEQVHFGMSELLRSQLLLSDTVVVRRVFSTVFSFCTKLIDSSMGALSGDNIDSAWVSLGCRAWWVLSVCGRLLSWPSRHSEPYAAETPLLLVPAVSQQLLPLSLDIPLMPASSLLESGTHCRPPLTDSYFRSPPPLSSPAADRQPPVVLTPQILADVAATQFTRWPLQMILRWTKYVFDLIAESPLEKEAEVAPPFSVEAAAAGSESTKNGLQHQHGRRMSLQSRLHAALGTSGSAVSAKPKPTHTLALHHGGDISLAAPAARRGTLFESVGLHQMLHSLAFCMPMLHHAFQSRPSSRGDDDFTTAYGIEEQLLVEALRSSFRVVISIAATHRSAARASSSSAVALWCSLLLMRIINHEGSGYKRPLKDTCSAASSDCPAPTGDISACLHSLLQRRSNRTGKQPAPESAGMPGCDFRCLMQTLALTPAHILLSSAPTYTGKLEVCAPPITSLAMLQSAALAILLERD